VVELGDVWNRLESLLEVLCWALAKANSSP
jgi:hypothetical protein